MSVPLSVLDLIPVRRGATAGEAMRESLALARHVETLGYHRYWFAEHHGMPGIASSAPAIMIGQVAAITSKLRVGSGGVMLPNHAPLAIAEQFGTLEALFPGRIDLGLGRAPGTDMLTATALRGGRRDPDLAALLDELWSFFRGAFPDDHPFAPIHAVPARGHEPPVWILGSSDYGARLAAHLGLPFAFAHHFSQRNTLPALAIYREHFTPGVLPAPRSMIGAIVVVADTDEEARRLALPNALAFLRLRSGRPGPYPSLEETAAYPWRPDEREFAEKWLASNVVGSPTSVRAQLAELLASTKVDELMVLCAVPDPAARQRSYTLLADLA
jgi:luciferase family oxidoreductase group 1